MAARPHEVDELRQYAEASAEHGGRVEFLDRDGVRALQPSPRWLGGVRAGAEHCVMVNPAKLAWGLAQAAERRGALVFEHSRVTGLRRRAGGVDGARGRRRGRGRARPRRHVGVLGLAPAPRPALRAGLRLRPDDRAADPRAARRRSAGRIATACRDSGNQFHYFRLSADDRILWGGYDAIYHPGNRVQPAHDQRPATFAVLERNFAATFPQLDGIRFTHRWGGAIDTTTRFTVTFGDVLGGRVHYALGYTGLGVGASRWAAGILRDKVLRPESDLLRLRFVRSAPLPIPPEPVRTPVVNLMRRRGDRRRHRRRPPRPVPAGDGRARGRLRQLTEERARRPSSFPAGGILVPAAGSGPAREPAVFRRIAALLTVVALTAGPTAASSAAVAAPSPTVALADALTPPTHTTTTAYLGKHLTWATFDQLSGDGPGGPHEA